MLSNGQESSISVQKQKARQYICENRLDEALDVCLNILRTTPDDIEILKVLGELYLAAGNGQAAAKILKIASKSLHKGEGFSNQIEIVDDRKDLFSEDETIPTSPEAIRQLLQNLAQRVQPVSEEEQIQAAQLLHDIVHSPRPAIEVAKRLNEIDNLLPALIELNIRQARVDGRPDLANGLNHLKVNIKIQKSILDNIAPTPRLEVNEDNQLTKKFSGKVVVFQPENDEIENNDRMRILKSTLHKNGLLMSADEYVSRNPDLVIFSSPFLEPKLMEKMALFSSAGVPIILDLGDYQPSLQTGQTTSRNIIPQTAHRAYASSLILADLVTVSSEAAADDLRMSGYLVMTIPNGWSSENPYWVEQKRAANGTLRMGWFGSTGNLEDLAVIRRPLIRLLREFEDRLRLTIVSDQNAYRMFDNVSEDVKTFAPCLGIEEVPYIINQMDILLVPERKIYLNHMPSDELLMFAGIKKIPWVASPLPAVENWKKGGLICKTMEEWHTGLRHLILDEDLRASMGNDGFQVSSKREMLVHIQQWYKAFTLVTAPQLEKNSPDMAANIGEDLQ